MTPETSRHTRINAGTVEAAATVAPAVSADPSSVARSAGTSRVSKFAHAGHVPDAPLVSAKVPGVPSAPACCVQRYWIVTLDGAVLRQLREKADLSQNRLANAAGLSVSTITKLERHARPNCHLRTRIQIAAALGIDPQAITAAPSGSG